MGGGKRGGGGYQEYFWISNLTNFIYLSLDNKVYFNIRFGFPPRKNCIFICSFVKNLKTHVKTKFLCIVEFVYECRKFKALFSIIKTGIKCQH